MLLAWASSTSRGAPSARGGVERALQNGFTMSTDTDAPCRTPSSDSGRARCIVVESGGTPSPPMTAEVFDETAIVAQASGEASAAFSGRVLSHIATAESLERQFQASSFFTGERCDDASAAARRLITLGFAAHVRAHGQPAELVLVSRPSATAAERSELLQLAGEAMATTRTLHVTVIFGGPVVAPRAPHSVPALARLMLDVQSWTHRAKPL